jgi:5'-nucleotidase
MARIVLTNDDGIEAEGLQVLFKAAEGLGERVVVAPDLPRSGIGHAVTTHGPIHLRGWRENWYAVGGTPADCSRLALTHLAQDAGWVLSGINRGGNLGADIYISGTVAAAREAAFLGCRAIAISQYVRNSTEIDWEASLRWSARILPLLMERPLRPRSFWNVNLPHLPPGAPDPEPVFCGLDLCALHVRYRVNPEAEGLPLQAHFEGDYHARERAAGRDVAVCFGGKIAITEIPLDITPY